MELVLEQKLAQKQVLTQAQMQSLELLAMTNYELYEYLVRESMENPLLDIEESSRQYQIEEAKWKYEQGRAAYTWERSTDSSHILQEIPEEKEETVEEYLCSQMIGLYPQQEKVLHLLISYVDRNGYLCMDEPAFCRREGISAMKMNQALTLLQAMEPAGVGARSLEECLIL